MIKSFLFATLYVDSVNDLRSEKDILNFVQVFRNPMRIVNVLKTFSQFKFAGLYMKDQ